MSKKHKVVKKTIKVAKNSKFQTIAAVIVVLCAAIVGYFLFIASHAASPSVSSEAESGTLSGSACKVSGDSTASNSSYVSFGGSQCSTSSNGKPLLGWWTNYGTTPPSPLVQQSTIGYGGPKNYANQYSLPGGGVPGVLALSVGPCDSSQAQAIGSDLVTNGQANAIIRIMWEFNNNTLAGAVWENLSASQYVSEFNSTVANFRAVPGQHFKFFWSPQSIPDISTLDSYYPGNANVDIIGFDIYDRRQYISLSQISSDIQNLVKYGASKGKPVALGEWGLDNSGTGAGDDPAFINTVAGYVNNPSNNFFGTWYFDDNGSDSFNSSLSQDPNSSAAFKTDFAGT